MRTLAHIAKHKHKHINTCTYHKRTHNKQITITQNIQNQHTSVTSHIVHAAADKDEN